MPLATWNETLSCLLLLSGLMFVGSLVLAWSIVVRLPADYFEHDYPPYQNLLFRHPVTRGIWLAVKNLFGLLLVVTGLIMLFTPGQGLLCILLGITLLNFPGKQTLVRQLLRRPGVLNTLNKLRASAKRPPLTLNARFVESTKHRKP